MEERIKLMLGDNMKSLKELPDNSVDSIVTDPPYALTSIKKRFGKQGSAPAQFGSDGAFQRASKGFMGKEWDAEVPTVEFWSEVYRVLKPGGHVLSFGGTRTYHRMAVNIEDAGFEIRDQIMWIYGSGFPKSHNIGKAIDKIQDNEREVIGDYETSIPQITPWQDIDRFESKNQKTKGNGDWEGWGTAIKPAVEPICVARKPLSEKSVAENVLKWGTGGLNIDASRIGFKDESDKESAKPQGKITTGTKENVRFQYTDDKTRIELEDNQNDLGRFPANVILDEEAGKILDEQSGIKQSQKRKPEYNKPTEHTNTYTPKASDYRDDNTYDDKGGASRFFYCPKVSKKERNAGLDDFEAKTNRQKGHGLDRICGNCGTSMLKPKDCKCETPDWITPPKKNTHPTVKPIKLMEYLITLVTPKGGVVLEPFMGSGSTGIAAKNLGMSFIGIEKEEEYFEIAKQRINGN